MGCGSIVLTVFLSVVVIMVLCTIVDSVCKKETTREEYKNTTNSSVHNSSMISSPGVGRSYKSSSYDNDYASSSSSYDYGDSSDSYSGSDCGSSDSGSSSCD